MPYIPGDTKFILDVIPKNLSENVAANTTINVRFGRDIDAVTLNSNTFKVNKQSDNSRIIGTITYQYKVATFVPNTALEPGETYCITLIGDVSPSDGVAQGIKDITGAAMSGIHTSIFTVTRAMSVVAPTLISPADLSVKVGSSPEFSFTIVDEATKYEISVADTQSFSNAIWNTFLFPTEDLIENDTINVTPTVELEEGEYFWKVRSFVGDTPGPWSNISQFVLKSSPPEDILHFDNYLEVISTSPMNDSLQVITDQIEVTFNTPINATTVNANSITIYPYAPIITIATSNNKITLYVELQNSTEYKVTIGTSVKNTDGYSLYEPYVLSFQTEITPMYCTVSEVLDIIGPWIPGVKMTLIARYIRESSLYLDEYALDTIDKPKTDTVTDRLIIPYPARQFVIYDASLRAMYYMYLEKMSVKGEKVVLGDFQISNANSMTPDFNTAYRELKLQRDKWHDDIMGVHYRGYSTPTSAVKSYRSANAAELPKRTF